MLERFRPFRKDIYREKSRLVKMEIKLDFTGPDETIFSDKANCKILKESKLGIEVVEGSVESIGFGEDLVGTLSSLISTDRISLWQG